MSRRSSASCIQQRYWRGSLLCNSNIANIRSRCRVQAPERPLMNRFGHLSTSPLTVLFTARVRPTARRFDPRRGSLCVCWGTPCLLLAAELINLRSAESAPRRNERTSSKGRRCRGCAPSPGRRRKGSTRQKRWRRKLRGRAVSRRNRRSQPTAVDRRTRPESLPRRKRKEQDREDQRLAEHDAN